MSQEPVGREFPKGWCVLMGRTEYGLYHYYVVQPNLGLSKPIVHKLKPDGTPFTTVDEVFDFIEERTK